MKKILSVLLAVCMLLSVAPMAFATEEGEVNEQVVEEVVDGIAEEDLVKEEFEVVADEEETEAPADDETTEPEMPVFDLSEAFAFVTALDFDGLVSYIGQFLNIETLKYAIDNALEKLTGLGIGDFLDGSLLDGMFESFTDVCATIADVLVELLAMVGIDFDQIVAFINNSEFLSFISSIYAYGGQGTPNEEPTTEEIIDEPEIEETEPEYEDVEIPETGVADMGIAAFAALTVAGAAAFVLKKKKA